MLTQTFQNYINQHIKQPTVIFEVGSRDLDQGIELARSYPQATIYSFEPNPEQTAICQQKAASFKNIKFFPLALSKENTTMEFHAVQRDCPDPNVGASSLLPFSAEIKDYWQKHYKKEMVLTTKYPVKCMTWKSFCEENKIERVDAAWVDAQGSETDIFNNAAPYLPKVIHAEAEYVTTYHNQPLYKDLLAAMTKLGYKEIYNRIPLREKDLDYLKCAGTDCVFIKL